MSYIGNSPGVASQRVVTTFTATNGQTTFTPTSGYTLGYCDVFFNGVKLVNGDDYTAADGVSVVLASGAAANDVVEVVAHFPRGLSDGYLKTEADSRFLSSTDGSVTTAKLAANAVTTAKITDSNVTTAKIADANVTTAKIADSAITSAKIADGTIATVDIADGAVTAAKLASDAPTGISDKANTSTGYFDLPSGTTAQRPASPNSGMARFNTDTGTAEVYGSSGWMQLQSGNDPYWANVSLYLRGGSLTDLKGNHTITSVNASTATTPGKPFPASPSTSWYYLNTSGSTDVYLNIANTLDDFDPGQNTNLTIEFWLYKDAGYSSYGHFYNIGGQDNQGVIKFAGDTAYGLYWYAGSETINWGGSGTFSAATWTHFAFEKQGSQLTTWKNGTRISQTTNSFPTGSPAFMRLGFRFNGEYCPHYFDELRVTKAARYGGAASIPVQTAPYPLG